MSTKVYSKLLVKIIRGNLLTTTIPMIQQYVIDKVIEKYDAKLLGKSPIEDPTAPENIKADFVDAMLNNIEDSLVISDTVVSFSLIDKSKLGYEGVRDPLSTLVFYLEGFLEEYAFLPRDVIRSMFKGNTQLGRYDKGYLVSKSTFFKQGWNKRVDWNKVSLKYATNEGIDIFNINLAEIDGIIVNTISKSIETFSSKVKNVR